MSNLLLTNLHVALSMVQIFCFANFVDITKTNLQVHTSDQVGCYVDGLSLVDVNSKEEVLLKFQRGCSNRDQSMKLLCCFLILQ